MIEAIGRVATILLNVLKVGGITTKIQTTLVRPNDTTAYAAGDTVASIDPTDPLVITFASAARIPGGSGYITGVRFGSDLSTDVSEYNLHLFSASPATIIGDNTNWDERFVNFNSKIGTINIPAVVKTGTAGDIAMNEVVGLRVPFSVGPTTKDIVAQLETVTGYTPAARQNYYMELYIEQN